MVRPNGLHIWGLRLLEHVTGVSGLLFRCPHHGTLARCYIRETSLDNHRRRNSEPNPTHHTQGDLKFAYVRTGSGFFVDASTLEANVKSCSPKKYQNSQDFQDLGDWSASNDGDKTIHALKAHEDRLFPQQ